MVGENIDKYIGRHLQKIGASNFVKSVIKYKLRWHHESFVLMLVVPFLLKEEEYDNKTKGL